MDKSEEPAWLGELRQKLPSDLLPLLDRRDGAALLLERLPQVFSPEAVATPSSEQRAWELAGLYYKNQGRFHEALPLFTSLYNHMLAAQEQSSRRSHKGMPLCWMSDCYSAIGFPVHAKRYLMLTLCEDAISTEGEVSPEASGVYFRLVWGHGLPDSDLRRYAKQMYELSVHNPEESFYPEWVLQELDQDWLIEISAPAEAGIYTTNRQYVHHLMSGLGEPTGKTLERLADYVLSCMPGCRTKRRQRSGSTDYDVVCSVAGFEVDFRSEFGRYFVCECKDWQTPAGFTTMAKFCRVLDSVKCRFGILFSKCGISGEGCTRDAEREQLKVFQDRGMVIVVVDEKDLKHVADGGNLVSLLRAKYERVRLDLTHTDNTASV